MELHTKMSFIIYSKSETITCSNDIYQTKYIYAETVDHQ